MRPVLDESLGQQGLERLPDRDGTDPEKCCDLVDRDRCPWLLIAGQNGVPQVTLQ